MKLVLEIRFWLHPKTWNIAFFISKKKSKPIGSFLLLLRFRIQILFLEIALFDYYEFE